MDPSDLLSRLPSTVDPSDLLSKLPSTVDPSDLLADVQRRLFNDYLHASEVMGFSKDILEPTLPSLRESLGIANPAVCLQVLGEPRKKGQIPHLTQDV